MNWERFQAELYLFKFTFMNFIRRNWRGLLVLIAILLVFKTCEVRAEIPKPTHEQRETFKTVCLDWFEANWETAVKFDDGDAIFQPIHQLALVRVEKNIVVLTDGSVRETDTEIYHIAVHFKAARFENGKWSEKKPMLQVLYLFILNGKVVNWDVKPSIPWNDL
jgi:hypothetical protein